MLQPLVVCFTPQWKNGLFHCRPFCGVTATGGLFSSSVVEQGKNSLCRLFCGVAAAGDPFHSLQPLAVHITPQWYNKGKTIEFCFSVNCFVVFAASRPRSPRLCSPFWQWVTTMTTRSCYTEFVVRLLLFLLSWPWVFDRRSKSPKLFLCVQVHRHYCGFILETKCFFVFCLCVLSTTCCSKALVCVLKSLILCAQLSLPVHL